jgi:hypothetical protein
MSDENSSTNEGAPDPIEEIGDPVELAKEDDGFLGTPWSRRTFLKAAALGTAAAAVFQKGPGFTLNPAAAWANDLSTNPCTAGDVTILGGTILNEPCSCTPGQTFNANVQFTVRNFTSTGRYCIVLHLIASGVVPAQDVILRDVNGDSTAPGKSGGNSFQDTVMFGTITGVPCSAGTICFGQALASDFRGKCDAGTCSTVAWSTTPGDADCATADQKPPGGQCRHQQICIQGFGVTLDCDTSQTGVQGSCTVDCGASATLRAIVTGGTGPNYTFCLREGTSTSCDLTSPACAQSSGPAAATSHDFTVSPTATTTYTVVVKDSAGCCRSASVTLTVNQPTVSLTVTGDTGCTDASNVVFTATAGFTNYDFKVDGTSQQSSSSNTFTYPVDADNTCHSVSVHATKGSCAADATKHITQCVTSTVANGACS